MPITTFQSILSTDKLQSGFRAKFNANVELLITDITDNGDGTATVELQGGTNFQVDLGTSFYTKAEVVALIGGVTTVDWGSINGDVAEQTDVVGNFGVLTGIDSILLSCNFAVDAADTDNPFFGFPASGYASFSVPGISGTGWQLLIKEAIGGGIKFRLYYDGAWHSWVSIQPQGGNVSFTITPQVSFEYTLDAGELADVNDLGRLPNFVALVGGQQFNDVYPKYTGGAGAYTQIDVILNTDSVDTLVQFS